MAITTDPPRGGQALDTASFRQLEDGAINQVLLSGVQNVTARDIATRRIRAIQVQARAVDAGELELYELNAEHKLAKHNHEPFALSGTRDCYACRLELRLDQLGRDVALRWRVLNGEKAS